MMRSSEQGNWASIWRVAGVLCAVLCVCLVGYTYYQMLFGAFSLPEFIQRAVLVCITAAVALGLHRLLLYRLPPSVLVLLWLVVLVQIAGVSLPQVGLLSYGLENQLPEVQLQTQETFLSDNLLPEANGAQALQAPTVSQEVMVSYQTGAAQTFAYAQGVATVVRIIWAGGALLLLAWFWGNYYYFAQRARKAQRGFRCLLCASTSPEAPQRCAGAVQLEASQIVALHANFAQAKRIAGVHGRVGLCITKQDGPLLLGVFRPKIILPAHLCKQLQLPEVQRKEENRQTALSFVLLHELTHAKHRDNLWSALAVAALATQWYNPLVWFCFVSLKRDIERRCDASVAALTKDKRSYASVLLKTIQGAYHEG